MSDVVGSVGVGLLLVAFALQRVGRIEERWYAVVNVVGAGAAAVASLMIGFIPFVVLELIWCLVALASLVLGPRPVARHAGRPRRSARS
ncbi:MAG: hypothetical protein QOE28_2046 [Solirubrobacteraceae bacterium]|nr:hypothetical protein [Solirubrobacteraceae bacterium]